MPSYLFYGSALTSVTIPVSVTSIGSSAFFGCYALTDVYYKGTTEQWNSVTVNGGNDPLEINDAVYLLYHSLLPEQYPLTQSGDFDRNGTVDGDDAIYLLYHVMLPEEYPLV